MITIYDNNLDNPNVIQDIVTAISGNWGNEDDLYLGKLVIGTKFNVTSITPVYYNNSPVDTMAIISYLDGTSENLHIKTTTTLSKSASMVLLIGRIQ